MFVKRKLIYEKYGARWDTTFYRPGRRAVSEFNTGCHYYGKQGYLQLKNTITITMSFYTKILKYLMIMKTSTKKRGFLEIQNESSWKLSTIFQKCVKCALSSNNFLGQLINISRTWYVLSIRIYIYTHVCTIRLNTNLGSVDLL